MGMQVRGLSVWLAVIIVGQSDELSRTIAGSAADIQLSTRQTAQNLQLNQCLATNVIVRPVWILCQFMCMVIPTQSRLTGTRWWRPLFQPSRSIVPWKHFSKIRTNTCKTGRDWHPLPPKKVLFSVDRKRKNRNLKEKACARKSTLWEQIGSASPRTTAFFERHNKSSREKEKVQKKHGQTENASFRGKFWRFQIEKRFDAAEWGHHWRWSHVFSMSTKSSCSLCCCRKQYIL